MGYPLTENLTYRYNEAEQTLTLDNSGDENGPLGFGIELHSGWCSAYDGFGDKEPTFVNPWFRKVPKSPAATEGEVMERKDGDITYYNIPPASSRFEEWELQYDDCRLLFADHAATFDDEVTSRFIYHDEEGNEQLRLHNRKRKIQAAVDGSDIYFQGLCIEYPEAWIRCMRTDSGNTIFENGQIIVTATDSDGTEQSLYLTPSLVTSDYYYPDNICVYYSMAKALGRNLSDVPTGNSETVKLPNDYYSPFKRLSIPYMGIAFTTEVNGKEKIIVDVDSDDLTDESKEYDIYYNVRLIKIEDSSVDNPIMNPIDSDIIYDISGRPVSPDHLAPGIYIRNGKKFTVSNR